MNIRNTLVMGVAALLLVNNDAAGQVTLLVDQSTGQVELFNLDGANSVAIIGYDIRSAQDPGVAGDGLLDPMNWADLDTALLSGWQATNSPTNDFLGETNANGSLTLGPEQGQSIGGAFTTNAASIAAAQTLAGFGNEYRDLTFNYTTIDPAIGVSSITLETGDVVYNNDIFNNLVLNVDVGTGEVELVNESSTQVTIESYFIQSAQGALDTSWDGLSDTVANWRANIATANALAEGSLPDLTVEPAEPLAPLDIAPGASFDLGTAFNTATAEEDRDLAFSFLLTSDQAAGSEGFQGEVRYVGSSAPAGDFNNDGLVDAADYAQWRNNLGGSEALINNLGDGDGVVDADDYGIWRNAYATALAAGSGSGQAVIPEPGTLAMICFGSLFGAVRRRR